MSRWFRMYADVIDDPKVQRLVPPLFKAWVNLLCLASRHDGQLPPMADIAFALRCDENVTRDIIRDLLECGLLEESDGLSPHNWRARQFKSDTDETATERKRKQRERDKGKEKSNVTPSVTDHVTRDTGVTSRPPEQSRAETEQSRAEVPLSPDPEHTGRVIALLDKHAASLTDWENRFLVSIKWAPALTAAQAESLRTIEARIAPAAGGSAKPMLIVIKGTPQYERWITYFRKISRTGKSYQETLDSFPVPTEFPPEEKAA